MIFRRIERLLGLTGRIAVAGALAAVIAGCSFFGPAKIKEEPVIPPEVLYQQAIVEMDSMRFMTAITALEKLERQHPYSEYNERAKVMQVYATFRVGKFNDAILAADRFLAVYPTSKDAAYVLWIKGSSYYEQIRDTTRDQQLASDAIDTFRLLIANYPSSEHAKDAREKIVIANDQLAGKEMSVGRYYLGNGQYAAAINRFRMVTQQYETSTHVEEALYRLAEANLALGLVKEAQTASAVLGHNYPASSWYKQAYELLQKQGLSPSIDPNSQLAGLQRT